MLFTIIYNIYRKQNPALGALLHEAFKNLIMCSKFNIVKKYIHPFYNLNNVFTEDGHFIFKYNYLNNFKSMLRMLDNIDKHIHFENDMIM